MDGGASWQKQDGIDSTINYESVFFIDSVMGWAVGSINSIVASTDGGRQWHSQYTPVKKWLNDVCFLDRDTGWIVGGGNVVGTILKSVDGGGNWRVVRDSSNGGGFYAIDFVDKKRGWIVGSDGWDFHDPSSILHTEDTGDTWAIQQSGHRGGLHSVTFADSNVGWAAGLIGMWLNSMVVKTTDGGRSWYFSGPTRVSGTPQDQYRSIESVGASVVLLGTNLGYIYRSSNGGESWGTDSVETPAGIWSIMCLDVAHCWACGVDGRIWKNASILSSILPMTNAQHEEPDILISVSRIGGLVDISYTLWLPLSITTNIYDILGNSVASMFRRADRAGTVRYSFDLHSYCTGTYFILSAIGNRTYINSFILQR